MQKKRRLIFLEFALAKAADSAVSASSRTSGSASGDTVDHPGDL
jgi:hypothetical protein